MNFRECQLNIPVTPSQSVEVEHEKSTTFIKKYSRLFVLIFLSTGFAWYQQLLGYLR